MRQGAQGLGEPKLPLHPVVHGVLHRGVGSKVSEVPGPVQGWACGGSQTLGHPGAAGSCWRTENRKDLWGSALAQY